MVKMTNKKAALHNLGCKVNSYEIEAAAQLLKSRGYELVPFEPGADIYIINTCSVTNIADRKSRQMLHKAKAMNPDSLVIAMGCYAQVSGDDLEKDDAVDIIIGNNRKKELVEIIDEYESKKLKRKYIDDLTHESDYEYLSISEPGEHIRGFMKVQDGCNQFCSYCIIPYARGRIRSRSIEESVNEAKRLASSGCSEVVLSGIHLSSYGKDLDEDITLLDLIKKIHDIDEIRRIRLGSLEPGIITREFAASVSKLPKVCPHFHLSLQSGCDKTLKAMNRKYTSEEYGEKCGILREFYDDPSITTDVITGFPGETEEDFEKSYEFVKSIDFFETHIFPYSVRKGTKAASMKDQNTEAVKKRRASRLIELNKIRHLEHLNKLIKKEAEVLIEEQQEIEGKIYWVGHTPKYEKIAVDVSDNLKNKYITVIADKILTDSCILGHIKQ